MNKYEFVYIIDAHATPGVKDEITKQINDALAKAGVKCINSQVWLERQRMSFPMKKLWEGTYYLLNLEAPAANITKLHSLLRINEQILRFMTIKVEKEGVIAKA